MMSSITSQFSVIKASVTASGSAGANAVTGLKVGDTVISAILVSNGGFQTPGNGFESIVSVADQLQEKAGLTNGDVYQIIFIRS